MKGRTGKKMGRGSKERRTPVVFSRAMRVKLQVMRKKSFKYHGLFGNHLAPHFSLFLSFCASSHPSPYHFWYPKLAWLIESTSEQVWMQISRHLQSSTGKKGKKKKKQVRWDTYKKQGWKEAGKKVECNLINIGEAVVKVADSVVCITFHVQIVTIGRQPNII